MTRARKAPPPANVPALERFHPHDRVRVTDGLSRDRTAVVVAREGTFGSEPTYRVYFGGLLGARLIRETYLTIDTSEGKQS